MNGSNGSHGTPEDDREDFEVRELLARWRNTGDEHAFESLTRILHRELRRLAHERMRRLRPGPLLQTTALMNEALLCLRGRIGDEPDGRRGVLLFLGKVMENIALSGARDSRAEKRGGGRTILPWNEDEFVRRAGDSRRHDDRDLDAALAALERIAPEDHLVFQLRTFGAFDYPEIADALGLSERTVRRRYAFAVRFLRARLDRTERAP